MTAATGTSPRRVLITRAATAIVGLLLWFAPVPEGLTEQAWHLFAIFAASIFAVIINAMPILPPTQLR